MGAPQPVPPILLDWSRALLESRIQTETYRISPGAPGGEPLIDTLSRDLAEELRELFTQAGLTVTTRAVLSAQRDEPETKQLNKDADARARRRYLRQLHADLRNRPVAAADGSRSEPAQRHLDAQVELWALARKQLEQGSFYEKKVPGYRALVNLAAILGYTEDDLLGDFWALIWPDIVDGRHSSGKTPVAPAEPELMYEWVAHQARAFISHSCRDFNRDISRIHEQWQAGQRAWSEQETPLDHLLDQYASTINAATQWYETEKVALHRIEEEALLLHVLQAFVSGAEKDRLGFLIYLFRFEMMPDVTGLNAETGGPNKQIAAVLESWRQDRAALRRYLTDDLNGLDLGEELANEITLAVEPGFAAFTKPITAAAVGALLARFTEAMRKRLDRALFDDAPPDVGEDESASAADNSEEVSGEEA